MSTNKPGIKSFNINGTEYDLHTLPENVKLSEDLYTYTAIGMAQKASNGLIDSAGATIGNKNPAKLGSAGDSLATVLTNIFGSEQDAQPTIDSTVKISVSSSTLNFGGSATEYGTAIEKVDNAYVEFTLDNAGTTTKSKKGNTYKCKDGSVKTTTNFYYPVTKQTAKGKKPDGSDVGADDKADLVITLPTGKDFKSIDAGTLVSRDGNTLYCNFSSKKVKLIIELPAGSVTTAEQTRYAGITANVKLGDAQTVDSLTATANTAEQIAEFLTYLDKKANSQPLSKSNETISNTSTAFKIGAGTKYIYYAVTDSTTAPTSWNRYGTGQTGVNDLQISANAGQYVWVASTTSYTYLQLFNDASGKYNLENALTSKTPSTNSLTNSQNVSADGYYFYSTGPRKVTGTAKLKLSNSLTA